MLTLGDGIAIFAIFATLIAAIIKLVPRKINLDEGEIHIIRKGVADIESRLSRLEARSDVSSQYISEVRSEMKEMNHVIYEWLRSE